MGLFMTNNAAENWQEAVIGVLFHSSLLYGMNAHAGRDEVTKGSYEHPVIIWPSFLLSSSHHVHVRPVPCDGLAPRIVCPLACAPSSVG